MWTPSRKRSVPSPREGELGDELVAQASNRHEVSRIAGVGLTLGSQSLDVYVERAGVPEVVGAPDPVDESLPSQYASGVLHEQLEELELLAGHVYRLPFHRHLEPLGVEPDATGLKHTVGGVVPASRSSEDRPDAGQELACTKWLGNVVVGSELEPHHLVDLGIACRQHDDGHARTASNLPANLLARHPGQHEIEQNEIGACSSETIEPNRPVGIA